jgi:drug/metabolite transporter (DMT)-like permease
MLAIFAPQCLVELGRFRASDWAAFGYLAVFLYGVSMVFFLRALRKVDAIVASASLYLVPLFGVVMAFAILKEHLMPQAVVGSVVVLLATWMLFRFDYAV